MYNRRNDDETTAGEFFCQILVPLGGICFITPVRHLQCVGNWSAKLTCSQSVVAPPPAAAWWINIRLAPIRLPIVVLLLLARL